MSDEITLLRELAEGEKRDMVTAMGDLMFAMRHGEADAKSDAARREVDKALSEVFEYFTCEVQKTPPFTVTRNTPARVAGKTS